MRQSLSVLLLAAAPLAFTAASNADDQSHWYAGFDLALSGSPEAAFTRRADSFSLEAKKHTGFGGGFYFGKKYGKNRLEFEYILRNSYFDAFELTGTSAANATVSKFDAGGTQKNETLMMNGWTTVAEGTNWSLLAGAGIGFSHLSLGRFRSGQTEIADGRGWAPTAQLMAEFVRPIGSGLEMGLGYRIVRSTKVSFDTNLGEAQYSAKHNELFARLSWRFGDTSRTSSPAPMAKPVQPVAPAPAPKHAVAEPARPALPVTQPVVAEPAPLPKPFIVYFAFDKSDISGRALDTIIKAAKAYRTFKAVEIQATGHTDTAGTESYNEKLAQARVEAVRNALVREGVPTDKIMLTAEGENKPAVITNNNVRESQNRRVEIKLVR